MSLKRVELELAEHVSLYKLSYDSNDDRHDGDSFLFISLQDAIEYAAFRIYEWSLWQRRFTVPKSQETIQSEIAFAMQKNGFYIVEDGESWKLISGVRAVQVKKQS